MPDTRDGSGHFEKAISVSRAICLATSAGLAAARQFSEADHRPRLSSKLPLRRFPETAIALLLNRAERPRGRPDALREVSHGAHSFRMPRRHRIGERPRVRHRIGWGGPAAACAARPSAAVSRLRAAAARPDRTGKRIRRRHRQGARRCYRSGVIERAANESGPRVFAHAAARPAVSLRTQRRGARSFCVATP
jgi:hypothetical protein